MDSDSTLKSKSTKTAKGERNVDDGTLTRAAITTESHEEAKSG